MAEISLTGSLHNTLLHYITERYAEAKEAWKLIAETLISEYGMTEDDNDVKWPRREIAQMEALIQ
jgi:hypothetical protein